MSPMKEGSHEPATHRAEVELVLGRYRQLEPLRQVYQRHGLPDAAALLRGKSNHAPREHRPGSSAQDTGPGCPGAGRESAHGQEGLHQWPLGPVRCRWACQGLAQDEQPRRRGRQHTHNVGASGGARSAGAAAQSNEPDGNANVRPEVA